MEIKLELKWYHIDASSIIYNFSISEEYKKMDIIIINAGNQEYMIKILYLYSDFILIFGLKKRSNVFFYFIHVFHSKYLRLRYNN